MMHENMRSNCYSINTFRMQIHASEVIAVKATALLQQYFGAPSF
ncbi:MAG TPA: hypothetical protein VFZ67_02530 [Nitrososphaera sp.]